MFRESYELIGSNTRALAAYKAVLAFAHITASYGAYHPRAIEYYLNPGGARDREPKHLSSEEEFRLEDEARKRLTSSWEVACLVTDAYKLACNWVREIGRTKLPKPLYLEVGEKHIIIRQTTPNGEAELTGSFPERKWEIRLGYSRISHAYKASLWIYDDWERKQDTT